MEISYDLLEQSKAIGQLDLVKTLLIVIGKAITDGKPVRVKSGEFSHDVLLSNFDEYSSWVRIHHSDILEL